MVAVSAHVETQFLKYGFAKNKLKVVENGIDCYRYNNIANAKAILAKELQISTNMQTVGFVGRYSFEKRPQDFVKLAAKLSQYSTHLHFIMVGSGNDYENRDLKQLISACDLEGRISLLWHSTGYAINLFCVRFTGLNLRR